MMETNPCCCCLLRPSDKDLNTPYIFLDATETFSHMLEECFQIRFTMDPDDCGICQECVGRLRDASDFKLQVQRSLAELQGRLGKAPIKEEDDELMLKLLNTCEVNIEMDEKYILSDAVEAYASEPGLQSRLREQLAAGCSVSLERLTHEAYTTTTSDTKEPATYDITIRNNDEKSTYDDGLRNEENLYRQNYECPYDKSKKIIEKAYNLIHKGNKSFTCDICSKQFRRKSDLTRHSLTHRKGPYINKEFSQNGSLREHDYDYPYTYNNKQFIENSPKVLTGCSQIKGQKSLRDCPKVNRSEDLTLHEQSDDKTHNCDICSKRYKSRESLIRHIRKHAIQDSVSEIVSKYPQYWNIFNKPTYTPTYKTYICDICDKQFTQRSTLIRHIRRHNGEKPHSCDICSRKFRELRHLKDHKLIHSGLKPYTCSICHMKFTKKNGLTQHFRTHTGETPYPCDICTKKFKKSQTLKEHQRRHAGDKRQKCEATENSPKVLTGCSQIKGQKSSSRDCLKINRSEDLMLHKQSDENHNCDICSKRYKSRDGLIRHIRKHAIQESVSEIVSKYPQYWSIFNKPTYTPIYMTYICDICDKQFTQRWTLIRHIRRHNGEKQHSCDICSRKFRELRHLKDHKLIHSGLKPYTCSICYMKFTMKNGLTQHFRTHTGETPYPCDICTKKFKQSQTLKEHQRRHAGDKRYKCEICEKQFVVKKSLIEHMRTHTGEKPYRCEFCSRMFSSLSGISQHRRTHIQGQSECQKCNTTFKYKSSLDRHLKKNHAKNKC